MKPFIKCILLTASVIMMTVCIASCQPLYVTDDNNPSVALREFCGYISDGDYNSAFELAGCTTDVSAGDLADSVEGALLEKTLASVSVNPVSEPEIAGLYAWQTAEITHFDLRIAVRELLSGVMEETTAYEWEYGSYKTDDEMSDAVRRSLLRQIESGMDGCMITERVRLKYRFGGRRWSLVMTRELYNVLTGYVSEATESVDEFFREYSPEKSRNTASE